MSAPVRVVANLDGEITLGRAAGRDVRLPENVLAGLSAVGSLLRVFARDGDVLELPRPLDPERVLPVDGLARPACVARADDPAGHTPGHTPPHRAWMAVDNPAVQRWAPRAACLELARDLGLALPGARVIADMDTLHEHLAADGARGSPDGRWVLKADWTAAGRGLVVAGPGAPDEALAARIAGRLASHGPLLFEPWLSAVVACGVAASLDADGRLQREPPHVQRVDARGRFRGLLVGDVSAWLPPEDAGALLAEVDRVAARLARAGLRGPFAVDALVHDVGGQRRVHPLVELNPRMSFGHVAAALHGRLGRGAPAGELVLDRAAPAGDAIPLLASGGVDGWGAWWIRHTDVP